MSPNPQHLVARIARKLSHRTRNGRWTLPELEEAIRKNGRSLDLRVGREPMLTLLTEGQVVQFKAGNQTVYTTPVHRISLADILKRARSCVEEGTGEVGSRSGEASRRVDAVTPSNLRRMEALGSKIADYLDPSRSPKAVLSDVGGERFVWDEENEDWSNFLELARQAAKHADLSKSTRYQYVGAGRKLLDLAATHGWIAASPKHQKDYEPVPAAWSEVFNRWREKLKGEGLDRVRRSLMTLLEACARLDQSPTGADWQSVIEHLEQWFEGNDVKPRVRTAVRRTYRALRENELLLGPTWDGRARQRDEGLTLLPRRAIRWVARRYGVGPEGTGEGRQVALEDRRLSWKGWSEYEEGLVSGVYGLRRALLFFTASAGDARLLGLPSRGTFPRERIRGTSKKSRAPWRVATVETNLSRILHVAGWMQKERGVDWSQRDLRTLLDLDALNAYVKRTYARDDFSTLDAVLRRVGLLARFASPYMEKTALDEGDQELADRMQHVSARLSSPVAVDGEPSWATTLKQDLEGTDPKLTQEQKARRVEDAWTDNQQAADYAYLQLRRVLDSTLNAIGNQYGPLGEQVEAIDRASQAGEPFDRQWARRIRDALYWQDQLVVPLRVTTSRRLDVQNRKHSSDFRQIYAEIGRSKMKAPSNGEFYPNYTRGGDGYRRALYRLYVMENGARELLRTTSSGVLQDVDAFYVFDLENSPRDRMTNSAFRNLVERVIREAEDDLPGITLKELKADNVLGTHFFRHAFATFMARKGRLEVAALYLHHSNLDMLRDVYSANSAADYDVADLLNEDLDATEV